MEPIQDKLQKWNSAGSLKTDGLKERLDKWKSHPVVQEFLQQHPEVDDDMLIRSANRIHQAVKEADACDKCPGLERCSNQVRGHVAHLVYTGSSVETVMVPCSKWIAEQQQLKREKYIKSHYIPKLTFSASFEDLDHDEGRADAIEAVIRFCLTVLPGNAGTKGIYLYGPFGVGKSYIMGAAAMELAKRDIHSLMIYTPDFFREIKSAIHDHSLEEKIRAIKEVPVLILDDIGAEMVSPWIRDEILAPVMQHRVHEYLPTLFTSNYDYTLLEEHLCYSEKGGSEVMKAKRLMDRIRRSTEIYSVTGTNRR